MAAILKWCHKTIILKKQVSGLYLKQIDYAVVKVDLEQSHQLQVKTDPDKT